MESNKTYFNEKYYKKYIKYLQKNKNIFSEEDIYNFISDQKRHNNGEESLVGSLIEKIEYNNIFDGFNNTMEIVLLREKKKFILGFSLIKKFKNYKEIKDMYHHLICFEVKKDKHNWYLFYAKFSNGFKIKICCCGITIKEDSRE
jgi:hypothetical protein